MKLTATFQFTNEFAVQNNCSSVEVKLHRLYCNGKLSEWRFI